MMSLFLEDVDFYLMVLIFTATLTLVIASEAKQSPEIKRLIPDDCPARRGIASLLAMTTFNGTAEWIIPILFANTCSNLGACQILGSHDDALNI
jgi:hypothetical protein